MPDKACVWYCYTPGIPNTTLDTKRDTQQCRFIHFVVSLIYDNHLIFCVKKNDMLSLYTVIFEYSCVSL